MSRGSVREGVAKPRKAWRWVVLGIVLLLLLPFTWLAAHRLQSRQLPPPPWSESDLPALADPSENGLDDLGRPGAPAIPRTADALLALVDPLGATTPPGRWADAVRDAPDIARFMDHGPDDGGREREIREVDAVLAAPRFADPCGSVSSGCPMFMPALSLFQFAAIVDLAHALRGDWPNAFARGAKLLAAADDMMRTARTMRAHLVALHLGEIATDHVRMLAVGLRDSLEVQGRASALPADVRAVLAAIETGLAGVRREDLHTRRAVIAESLYIREGLVLTLANSFTYRDIVGDRSPFWVDARSTIAASDSTFVDIMRWVEAPDHRTHAPPAPRVYASGAGWWLWNPGGKLLLDRGSTDLPSHINHFDNAADMLFESRDALRHEVRTLLQ